MNEQDFRVALHQAMAGQQAPPPMSDGPVLDAAHRDRRRRRALFAGVGSAAAVVVIAVGVVVLAPIDRNPAPSHVGGAQVTTTTTIPSPDKPSDTEPSWPNGQTDRTARQGPQYDRGVALAGELDVVIPDGYESPDDLRSGDGSFLLKSNQAQYADTVDGVEVWEYMAIAPLTKGAGVGELIVEVHTPDARETGQGCAMTPLWGVQGSCTEISVDGKTVAVGTTDRDQFDQWAGYRYEDGTVVYVAQSKGNRNSGKPALDGLPFTQEQLAALAVDPRFRVD